MTGLQPWQRGIDSSGLHAGASAGTLEQVKHDGGSFICRYSAGAASDPAHPAHGGVKWKLCEEDEVANAAAAGLDFIAFSEWYRDRVTEGYQAGKDDGDADRRFWQSRRLSRGSVILPAWDTAPSRKLYGAVEDYLRGYADGLDDYYTAGLYAGDPALRRMKSAGLIVTGHLPMATSWSGRKFRFMFEPGRGWKASAQKLAPMTVADMVQNGNRWFGSSADENVILRPGIPSHLAGGKPARQPAAKPKPKPARQPAAKPKPKPAHGKYVVRPSDSDGLIAVCQRHGISDWRKVARLNHIAGPDYVIRAGDVIRWPGRIVPKRRKAVRKTSVKVRRGDTLSAIASRWGVSVGAVKRANPHAGHPPGNFDVIWPGDRIRHP